jgi:hypothetical protein
MKMLTVAEEKKISSWSGKKKKYFSGPGGGAHPPDTLSTHN